MRFDIVAWGTIGPASGILFHTLTIHGGATVPPGGARNTLCVRFIDAEVRYKPRPERALNGNLAAEATDFLWEGLEDGMPVHQRAAIRSRSTAGRLSAAGESRCRS